MEVAGVGSLWNGMESQFGRMNSSGDRRVVDSMTVCVHLKLLGDALADSGNAELCVTYISPH